MTKNRTLRCVYYLRASYWMNEKHLYAGILSLSLSFIHSLVINYKSDSHLDLD